MNNSELSNLEKSFERKMRRPRFSVTIRRLLLRIFANWAEPLIEAYQEPKRAGTPKGDKIGLSRSKYLCALLQALHGPFSLPELSQASFKFINIKWFKLTGTSTVLMKLWRTEEQFRDEVNKASRAFADYLLICILDYSNDDIIQQLLLSEALVLLPGFDITNNVLLDKINYLIQQPCEFEVSTDPIQKKDNFIILDKYLCIYGNVIDMITEYSMRSELKNLEKNINDIVNTIRPNIENLLNKGKLSDIISDNDVKVINEDLDSIALCVLDKTYL